MKDTVKIDEKMAIRKMTIVGVAGNIVLTAFKFYAGIFGKSSAMITDAIHSLTDVFATLVAYLGATLARRPADERHEYGHERIETLASIILGCVLFITGGGIAVESIKSIIYGEYLYEGAPEIIAIVAAIVSIIVKEAMFWYTMFYAKKLNSSAFKADAWHHRSDALSSIGALVGIIGSICGLKVLEEISCVFIAILIIKVAIDILRDGVSKLVDTSCGKNYESELRQLILAQTGVLGIDVLRTRKHGDKKWIDVEICVDGELTLCQAHKIAEQVHEVVEQRYSDVKHIMIHVNPFNADDSK